MQQGPGQFLAQEATAAGDDDLHLVILRLVHVQGRYCCVSQPSPSRVPGSGVCTLAAYPVVVARLRQRLEQVGVGDLPLVRLVAIRHRGDLDVADGRTQLADEAGEIPSMIWAW